MQSGNTEDLKNIAIKEMQPSKGAKKAIRLQFFRQNYATKRQMKGKKTDHSQNGKFKRKEKKIEMKLNASNKRTVMIQWPLEPC